MIIIRGKYSMDRVPTLRTKKKYITSKIKANCLVGYDQDIDGSENASSKVRFKHTNF